jgi:hypothetical protein
VWDDGPGWDDPPPARGGGPKRDPAHDGPAGDEGWDPSSSAEAQRPRRNKPAVVLVVAVIGIATFILCCAAARELFRLMFLDVPKYP